jgi:hypothetical protein
MGDRKKKKKVLVGRTVGQRSLEDLGVDGRLILNRFSSSGMDRHESD